MNEQKYYRSELAKLAGVSKETVRFYEQNGLLPAPERSAGGYRLYAETDRQRLIFISNAKNLGFSLTEIKELLHLADGNLRNCKQVSKIAEKKVAQIEAQLSSLVKLKQVLLELINRCQDRDRVDPCPIIESLQTGAENDKN